MYPNSYILFLSHFHGDRDYFECHEVLEEYWKSPEGGFHPVWVGLIQTAVGFYHYRRGNVKGATRMFEKSKTIIQNEKGFILKLGLNYDQYMELMNAQLNRIERRLPYESVCLPINDQNLLKLVQQTCSKRGWEFGTNGYVSEQIIDRHKLRDRTDVIVARKQSLKKKKERNKGHL